MASGVRIVASSAKRAATIQRALCASPHAAMQQMRRSPTPRLLPMTPRRACMGVSSLRPPRGARQPTATRRDPTTTSASRCSKPGAPEVRSSAQVPPSRSSACRDRGMVPGAARLPAAGLRFSSCADGGKKVVWGAHVRCTAGVPRSRRSVLHACGMRGRAPSSSSKCARAAASCAACWPCPPWPRQRRAGSRHDARRGPSRWRCRPIRGAASRRAAAPRSRRALRG